MSGTRDICNSLTLCIAHQYLSFHNRPIQGVATERRHWDTALLWRISLNGFTESVALIGHCSFGSHLTIFFLVSNRSKTYPALTNSPHFFVIYVQCSYINNTKTLSSVSHVRHVSVETKQWLLNTIVDILYFLFGA